MVSMPWTPSALTRGSLCSAPYPYLLFLNGVILPGELPHACNPSTHTEEGGLAQLIPTSRLAKARMRPCLKLSPRKGGCIIAPAHKTVGHKQVCTENVYKVLGTVRHGGGGGGGGSDSGGGGTCTPGFWYLESRVRKIRESSSQAYILRPYLKIKTKQNNTHTHTSNTSGSSHFGKGRWMVEFGN